MGYVRARDGLLRGVILFDHEFEVASAFSNIRRRDKLQILNLQRRLLIKCDGARKRQDLANYIKEMTKRQGNRKGEDMMEHINVGLPICCS